MTLTQSEANALLVNVDTAGELRALIAQLDISATGATTVLYSGVVGGGGSANDVVLEMVDQGADVRVIDETEAAKFLNLAENPSLSAKLQQLFGSNPLVPGSSANQFMFGIYDVNGSRISADGVWDDVSKRFAADTFGDVRVIAPNSDVSRIFGATELPALLDNPAITSIEGIPIEDLRKAFDLNGASGLQTVFNQVQLASEASVVYGGVTTTQLPGGQVVVGLGDYLNPQVLDLQSYLLHHPEAHARMDTHLQGFDAAARDRRRALVQSLLTVEQGITLSGGARVLNKLGILGSIAGFALATNSAAAAESAGDSEGAKEIMALWAADMAGSVIGETIGAVIGGIVVGAAVVAGAVISAPLAGAIVVGAALVGGIFGADGAAKLYEMTKDLDDNGRMDLLDKLGNLLFGVGYTITSPLPADLNGAQLTLDATYSREDIVALAQDNIAWRYALRELNPFAITDVSYAQHNTDGSLDLFDPATGQGEMTEAYLADRAAMLTWKIRFDRGMRDDNDGVRVGPKSYTEDWDTHAVQGNWDFVDLNPALRLPGGAALTLAIDGQGLSLHDHQVVFGSSGADTIEGEGASDRLYGGAGNDSISGEGGADHLEGNAGNDTLIGGEGNDTLLGGTGTDVYQFTGTFGKDILIDSDGQGSIQIDGHTLGPARGAGRANVWVAQLGTGTGTGGDSFVTLTLLESTASSTGKVLVISREGNTSSSDTITINHFNPQAAAQPGGYLGIQLDPVQRLALVQGSAISAGASTTINTWSDTRFEAARLNGMDTSVAEGGGKSFTVSLSRAALAGETLTLALTGALADQFKVNNIDGGTLVNANGAVITLAPGQTFVSFNLMGNADLSADLAGSLSVSYQDTTGATTSSSNGWGLTLADSSEAGQALTLVGGVRVNAGTYQHWLPAGGYETRILPPGEGDYLGEGNTGEDSTIHDSTTNTTYTSLNLSGLAGNDVLFGRGSADRLDGGTGDDVIFGGLGADQILGGDGNDVILANVNATGFSFDWTQDFLDTYNQPASVINGLSTFGLGQDSSGQYTTGKILDWDVRRDAYGTLLLPDFLALRTGDAENPDEGDTVDAGAGDDLVWGSLGEDFIQGGTGHDQLQGLGGSDVLLGGDGNDEVYGDSNPKPVFMAIREPGSQAFNLDVHPSLYPVSPEVHGDDHIDAGSGNDKVWGNGGHDTVLGGDGDDQLHGDDRAEVLSVALHGDDYLDGEGGNDSIMGGGGNDVLLGGAGNDLLIGDLDDPEAAAGADELHGGDGDDELQGGAGNDMLLGGAGNDVLHGDSGDDVLQGGAGVDFLLGGAGDDTYVFDSSAQASSSRIVDTEGSNRIRVSGKLSDIQFRPVEASPGAPTDLAAGSLVMLMGDRTLYIDGGLNGAVQEIETHAGERVTVREWVSRNVNTSVSLATGAGSDARVMWGGRADDVLTAGVNGSEIWGGQGNDDIVLNAHGNTIHFERGDGLDQLLSTTSEGNIIALGQGITMGDLQLEVLAGGEVRLNLGGGDAMRLPITRETIASSPFVSHIRLFDGQTVGWWALLNQGVLIQGSAADDVLEGTDVGDIITGGAGDDALLGHAGDDILEAGPGASFLDGGEGDDTFRVKAGDGFTYILDDRGRNTLSFGAGLSAQALTATQPASTQDLVLSFASGETVHISGGMQRAIDRITFADGLTMTFPELLDKVSANALVLAGDDAANELVGALGADVLTGHGGNDKLWGNGGGDELSGGVGDDLLVGGRQNDVLRGGEGDDAYRFALGDGQDIIEDVEGNMTLEFGAGIAATDLVVTRETTNGVGWLRVVYSADDVVLIKEGDALASLSVKLADGRVLNKQETYAVALQESTTVTGTAANETLYGYAGSDTLNGGGGSDVLHGGRGQDVYAMSALGRSAVQEQDGGLNVIRTLAGSPSALSLQRVGADLLVDDAANQSRLLIEGFFNNQQAWSLQLADDSVSNLRDLVSAQLALKDGLDARRDAFYQQVVGLNGPDWQHAYTDAVGNEYTTNHTTTRAIIEANGALIAANSSRSQTSSSEVIGSYQQTYSYIHYATQTTTLPGAIRLVGYIEDDLFFSSAGQRTSRIRTGPHTFTDVDVNGRINFYTFEPDKTIVTAVPQLVSGEYTVSIHRGVQDNTLIVEDMRGGDGDNHLLLQSYPYTGAPVSTMVSGGAGNDLLNRTEYRYEPASIGMRLLGDFLDGGSGTDRIFAGVFSDEISGGTGSDYLSGSAGDDTYFVASSEDGFDTIYDMDDVLYHVYLNASSPLYAESYPGILAWTTLDQVGRRDVVRFGSGIDHTNIAVERVSIDVQASPDGHRVEGEEYQGPMNALQITWGTAGGIRVAFDDTLANAVGFGIERFEFADGTVWTMQQMLDAEPPQPGDVHHVVGTPGNDTLQHAGSAGSTAQIEGGAGDDLIEIGPLGRNTVVYRAGDGVDTIHVADEDGDDTLRFADLELEDLAFTRDGDSLFIRHLDDPHGSVVVLADFFAPSQSEDHRFSSYVFGAQGLELTAQDLIDRVQPMTEGTALDDELDGGAGNDLLYGWDGDDAISGMGGDDAMFAGAGNDVLEGGLGSDTLVGGAGDDWYWEVDLSDTIIELEDEGHDVVVIHGGGGSLNLAHFGGHIEVVYAGGFDSILGTAQADEIDLFDDGVGSVIDGGLGNDTLAGGRSNDVLLGGEGDDSIRGTGTLNGGAGQDVLSAEVSSSGAHSVLLGGAGEDELYYLGVAGSTARIEGGAGNDFIGMGPYGQNTVIYRAGDGIDTIFINDEDGDDILQFADIALGDLAFVRYYSTLAIAHRDDPENSIVLLENFFSSSQPEDYRFASYVFGEQEIALTAQDLIDLVQPTINGTPLDDALDGGAGNDLLFGFDGHDTIQGMAGNDVISAGGGDDVLDGGLGDDTLVGSSGDDVIVFGRGSGADLVAGGSASQQGDHDLVQFGADIGQDQLWFEQVGYDLRVSVIGTADSITVAHWYPQGNLAVDEYRLDEFRTQTGESLLKNQVDNLVNAMAAFSPPPMGQFTLDPQRAASLGTQIAASWQ